jgi:hypothetical protein
MVSHLTLEQRQLALRLKARGLSLRQIRPQVGCPHQAVALIARAASLRPRSGRTGGFRGQVGRGCATGRRSVSACMPVSR